MRHLICFGNDLHGDDGFGLAVYQRLQDRALPPDTRLFAAATRGLDAMALFEGCDEAVVIDAMAPRGEPGRLHWLAPDEVLPETAPNLPGHGAGVGHLLHCLALLGGPLPRVRILAAEAGAVQPFRPGLSAAVSQAVERAVAELVGA